MTQKDLSSSDTSKKNKEKPFQAINLSKTASKSDKKFDKKDNVGSTFSKEGEPRRVEKVEFEQPPELQEWVQEKKSAEEVTLPEPIKDEYGKILLKAAKPVKPKIILPLDDQTMKKGIKKKATDAVYCLVVWCIRQIKKFPGRVFYRE